MRRLLVVYNPRSSRFDAVKTDVLRKLPELSGFMVGKYEVVDTDVDDNAEKFAKLLKDEDLVVSAGGDATATIAANGILRSGKDVKFAVLPYGNFNDLARTLGLKKFEQVLEKEEENEREFYPLEILVDGKFFRYAMCYVTIGMTAEAVELFDDEDVRKKLQRGSKSSWRSYVQLASWYFKNRHRKVFIPEFRLNGELQSTKISDYAAVNGKSMARVMKGGEDYRDREAFRSEVDRLTNFGRLFKLMMKSMLSRIPGEMTKGDVLEFLAPATVEVQAEGEYRIFENIKRIEIRKSKKCLRVIEN